MPFRLVTNTTSRSRAHLVERLRGYGFRVEPEEIFSAALAGVALAREAGYRTLAPYLPAPALEDLKKALDDKNEYVVRVVKHTLAVLGEK